MHKVPSYQTFFRKSQEISMAHLVRHPRLYPFEAMGGRFGMDSMYEAIQLLGRGGTGQTWLSRELATGDTYAIKLMQRPIPRNTINLTYNELTIQAQAGGGHINCCHIREVVLTLSHLAMVLEYERGGSCAEYVASQIPKVGRLDLCAPEDAAQYMFKQLVKGVEHLHQAHIAHRDIKLDNTLLSSREPTATVKLTDFQFSKFWGRPKLTRMNTHLGTAVYMSPEILSNRQDRHAYDPVVVDVWACGIWLVALLVGAFPYDNRPGADDTTAEMQILHQEMSGSWRGSKFVRPYIAALSPECIDLIDHILHPNPELRSSLDDIISHPWFTKPLTPQFQAAWEGLAAQQAALQRRLGGMTFDEQLVHYRNTRVYELVREAARRQDVLGGSSQEHLCRLPKLPMVDCDNPHGLVRIDMRPEAVCKAVDPRAAALLDKAEPAAAASDAPPTPARLSSGGAPERQASRDSNWGLAQASPFAALAQG